MAFTTYSLAGDVSDIIGQEFDPNHVEVELKASDPIVSDGASQVRIRPVTIQPEADGTFEIPDIPATVDGAPLYALKITQGNPKSRNARPSVTVAWFEMLANDTLGAVVERTLNPVLLTPDMAADIANVGAEADRAEAAADRAVDVSNIEVSDDVIDATLAIPGSKSALRLSATSRALIASRVGGLIPTPASGATETIAGTTPRVVDVFGGYVWGRANSGEIHRSANDGDTWSLYATMPATQTIRRIVETSDGEVLVVCANAIYKSTGWAGGSPTFTIKATPNATSTFMAWGIDGDGTRFLTTEYSGTRADSRYVRMSLDAGNTWNVVYDSVAVHGATLGNNSHLHGCCYDPYADRWYFTEGHDDGGSEGDIAGIYCSEDDGATWARADGMAHNPGPTVLVATPDGLVCGSDHQQNGLYGVRRQDDPADEALAPTWRWQTGRPGLVGFATRGYVQPETGVVFMGWTTAFSDVAPIIAAGTVDTGGLVYTWPTLPVLNSDTIGNIVLPTRDKFIADGSFNAVPYIITGKVGAPSAVHPSVADSSAILGGHSLIADSIAVGKNATTGDTAPRSVAVGILATAGTTTDGAATAVGYDAEAVTYGVAVGSEAQATGTGGAVALGRLADATAQQTVAVGMSAVASANLATAVGHAASVSVAFGTAVGSNASVSALSSGTAIGANAVVTHTHGVAIGRSSATTRDYQIAVGPRHFEIGESATLPTNPTADKARLYVADNGAGKTGLYVRFPTGAAIQLALEV
jgi:hypothetical protein